MKLSDLLDVGELRHLLETRHIIRRNHPTLPIAILNYSNECMFENFWPETVQHCRGLIINPVYNHDVCGDCEVVSRPFHKFFNLNHSGQIEYQEINLPQVVPTVTEKMDGWFGILWKCGEEYGIASRGSFTSPGAVFATEKLKKLIKYGAISEFPSGYSAIFEIIFKAGKIVVDYPYEGLVLLGLVNNETGEEMPYDQLKQVWANIAIYSADRPWIRLVKAHNMSIGECNSSDKKNFEGFVLSYARPGTWPIKVKVKLEEYKRLHKVITGITPQMIWKELHDPMAPWLGGDVPDHFRAWAIKWRDELYQSFQHKMTSAVLAYDWAIDRHGLRVQKMKEDRDARKTLLDSLKENYPDYYSTVMLLLDGKIYEAHQTIWKGLRPVGRSSEVFYREGQGE